MEALIEFLQTPQARHIKTVYFNDKQEWAFIPTKGFDQKVPVEELTGGYFKHTVSAEDLEANPDLVDAGVEVGEEIEIPVLGGPEEEAPAEEAPTQERPAEEAPKPAKKGGKKQ